MSTQTRIPPQMRIPTKHTSHHSTLRRCTDTRVNVHTHTHTRSCTCPHAYGIRTCGHTSRRDGITCGLSTGALARVMWCLAAGRFQHRSHFGSGEHYHNLVSIVAPIPTRAKTSPRNPPARPTVCTAWSPPDATTTASL